jgi:2',3'-cyclic-nucleotide 2'-phosphodiesterase (5'-nucleotidase family)
MKRYINNHIKNIRKKFYPIFVILIIFLTIFLYFGFKTEEIYVFYTSDIKGNICKKTTDGKVFGLITLPYILQGYDRSKSLLVDIGNSVYKTYSSRKDNANKFLELMSYLNYDALNIGASELSFGNNSLSVLSEQVTFPFISSNLVSKTQRRIQNFLPYTIKQIDGIRIGVLGLSDQDVLAMNMEKNVKNYDLAPTFQTLKKYVNILRVEEKVDIIILLSRLDIKDERNGDYFYKSDNINIAEEVEGIDVIISKAKSNEKLCNTKIYINKNSNKKTIICNTSENLEHIGKLKLVVKKKSRNIVNFNNEIISTKVDLNVLIDFFKNKNLKEKIKYIFYKKDVLEDKTLGKTKFPLFKKNERELSNLSFFIADIIKNKTNSDIAILENIDISENLGEKEKIVYEDIFNLFSNNYQIVKLKLKGKDLIKLLEKNLKKDVENYINTSGVFYFFDNNKNIKKVVFYDSKRKFNLDEYYEISMLERMLNSKSGNDLYMDSKDIEYTNYFIIDIILENIMTFVPIDNKYKYENLNEKIEQYK